MEQELELNDGQRHVEHGPEPLLRQWQHARFTITVSCGLDLRHQAHHANTNSP